MKNVELFIIPYAKDNEIKTRLIVDGNKIDSKDNRLTNLVVYQPMRKWLNPYKKKLFVWGGILSEIIEEFNDKSIHFVFNGCKADFTLFKKSILLHQMNLNRNGGAVSVSFEFIDKLHPQKTIEELLVILDDLYFEADNWGEDGIIDNLVSVKNEINCCEIAIENKYHSDPVEFQDLLQQKNISTTKESVLTVIPVDGNIPVSDIYDYVAMLHKENDINKVFIVVNTLMRENDELLDNIVLLDSASGFSVKYIENDSENYIEEIMKIYYLYKLPDLINKTIEILHMFPDYKTNNFLIDISDKINDLFYILFN